MNKRIPVPLWMIVLVVLWILIQVPRGVDWWIEALS